MNARFRVKIDNSLMNENDRSFVDLTQQEYVVSASRAIAIIGLFSALYIVSAGIVSSLFGEAVRGYPEHFLRGILMTVVVVRTGKKWSATTMGLVCGIVFGIVVPAPAPYILVSTIVSGLVFDLALAGGKYASVIRSLYRVVLGSAVSGVAESVVALLILTAVGFFGSSFSVVSAAWSADIILNVVLSSIGAIIAFRFLSRRQPVSISNFR
ncbi:MAG: hypothetical protein JRN15_03605 [Nitrososphaerota archaeon]|nr:hypothetical protein [Nitrososphaerota archaeon]